MKHPAITVFQFTLVFLSCMLLATGCKPEKETSPETAQIETDEPVEEQSPFIVVENSPGEVHESEDDTEAYYRAEIAEGLKLEQEGKFEDASRVYELLTAEFPARAGAYHRLARTHEQLNDAEMAQAMYEEALRQNPTDPAFFNDYGWFLLAIGEQEAAYAALQNACALAPEVSAYQGNLGICLARMRRYEEAFLQLKKAWNGNSAEAHVALALTQLDMGDIPAAKASADSALTLDPENKNAREAKSIIEQAGKE